MEYKFIVRIKDKFSFVSYSNSIDLHIKDPQHIFSSYSWETRKLGRFDSYLRNHSPTHPLTDIASKKWNRNLFRLHEIVSVSQKCWIPPSADIQTRGDWNIWCQHLAFFMQCRCCCRNRSIFMLYSWIDIKQPYF